LLRNGCPYFGFFSEQTPCLSCFYFIQLHPSLQTTTLLATSSCR
jgi:hypothetical protein